MKFPKWLLGIIVGLVGLFLVYDLYQVVIITITNGVEHAHETGYEKARNEIISSLLESPCDAVTLSNTDTEVKVVSEDCKN